MTKKNEPGFEPWLQSPFDRLKAARNAWNHGYRWGLVDAILIWQKFFPEEPLPKWVMRAMLDAAENYAATKKSTKKGQKPRPKCTKGQGTRLRCYLAVRDAGHEKAQGEAKVDRAVKMLNDAGYPAKPGTVEYYHSKMRSALKSDKTRAEYHAFMSPTLRKRYGLLDKRFEF